LELCLRCNVFYLLACTYSFLFFYVSSLSLIRFFMFFSRPSSEKLGRVILLHPTVNFLSNIKHVIQTANQSLILRSSRVDTPPSSPTYMHHRRPPHQLGTCTSLALLSHLLQSLSLMTPDPRSDLRRGRRILSRFRGCRLGRRTSSESNQEIEVSHPSLFTAGRPLRRPNIRYLFEFHIGTGTIEDPLVTRVW